MKRFISEDPTGMTGSGTNLYAYANNDPLDYTDPTGLFGLGDIANAIDTVVPDPVSDFSAGLFDGVAAGIPSRALGIPQQCWGSAHAFGQIGGSAIGSYAAAGLGTRIALRAIGSGVLAPAIAGGIGGAAGGAYGTAGRDVSAGWGSLGAGAGAGFAGGFGGGALTGRFGNGAGAAAGATLTSEAEGYSVGLGTGQSATVSVGAKDDC